MYVCAAGTEQREELDSPLSRGNGGRRGPGPEKRGGLGSGGRGPRGEM